MPDNQQATEEDYLHGMDSTEPLLGKPLTLTARKADPQIMWGVLYADRSGYVHLLLCGSEEQARAWRPFPSTSGKPDENYRVIRKQVVQIPLPDATDIPFMEAEPGK